MKFVSGLALVGVFFIHPSVTEEKRVPVIVELGEISPSAVAGHHAQQDALPFDREAHEVAVLDSQRSFLNHLGELGVRYVITRTPMHLATGFVERPNQFTFLINAVALEVPESALDLIRTMPEVKRLSKDEPLSFHLDNSIEYVRASDGPGSKTIFSQNGGPLTRFDGTGQVVAILDTGIEHTHPAFDTRFADADFEMRTGDVRPVRMAGEPYVEGTHHPKVVYFLPLTVSSNEDDVGHGTHCGTDSTGLKVRGPGLDRIPGNADDQIIEGVAPGALLMNYKVCETTFTCVGNVNIITALEDALSPTDPAGNPKPVATVVNMSFGGGSGDPGAPSAVAADNAALLGAVMIASAGNAGPGERTLGAPAAARRVTAVAASLDPGAIFNELDVLVPNPLRYGIVGMSTGAQNDAGQPVAPEDQEMKAIIMGGAPQVTFPLGQHYVYVGLADSPSQVPNEVSGRIALALRGSTVDVAGASGTGVFGNKAAQVTAKGAVALLVMNNVDGELEATTAAAATIPVFGVSKATGEYLRDTLGFQNPLFDPDNSATWGTISDFPLRIDPPDPSTFDANTTGFSSRGPIVASQYVKPDVTAPGQDIYAATIAAGGVSTGGGTMSDPSRYISVSGTSFSGPTVAGSAALLRHALLVSRGGTPLTGSGLRSGAFASAQLAQFATVSQSLVRAALANTATNLREEDNVTPIPDSDERTFLHEIGAGLIHVVEAVDVRAVLGTNDANGLGGPDDADVADFLATFSFGEDVVIDTGIASQTSTVTVTLENVTGSAGGGTYALSLVDVGGIRGDVTAPITGTTGFQVALSSSSAVLGSSIDDRATFDVTVTVDGRPSPTGLAPAGVDVTGSLASEFLWYVVASGANGEVLRMPMSYRALKDPPSPNRAQPSLLAIEDDAFPDQRNGKDRDGNFKLSWTYPLAPAEQPCAFVIEEARTTTEIFEDDAEEALVAGENSTWAGDPSWVSATHPDTGTLSYTPFYADLQDVSLTLVSPISLPAGGRASLSFDSFEDIEPDFDFVQVEASGDGGAFVALAIYTGDFSGRRNVDLSGFAGQDVLIRLRLISDCVVSSPLFLGWFVDNLALETADFVAIATVNGSTFSFDVKNRLATTMGPRAAQLVEKTFFYRVGGKFGMPCVQSGPFSNIRDITVNRTRTINSSE